MKMRQSIVWIAFLYLAAAGCQRCPPPCADDSVCNTYVHRYGVPLPADDWVSRGQCGQVVSQRKDGVAVSKTYENGILHGETCYTFPYSQTVHKAEKYANGSIIQEKENHSSGIPSRQVDYDSPSKKTVTAWYETGSPQFREVYENDSLAEGEYYLPNGQVESRVLNYEGLRIVRDSFGQLVSKDEISHGEINSQTVFYPGGTPKSIIPYVNGRVSGQVLSYQSGGEPSSAEEWQDGSRQGVTVIYRQGEKYAEVPYVNGLKHGVERRYKDGKDLIEEVNWVSGQRQGPSYIYVNGRVATQWYYQDKEVNKSTYNLLTRPLP